MSVVYSESNDGRTIDNYSPIETFIGLWNIYLYWVVFIKGKVWFRVFDGSEHMMIVDKYRMMKNGFSIGWVFIILGIDIINSKAYYFQIVLKLIF